MEKIEITKDQAIKIGETKEYESWSLRQRAMFQIRCDLLCMPFSVFHEAIEKTLGRPVFTHEFALNRDGLYSELLGQKDAPDLDEIMSLIPKGKLIVVKVDSDEM